jgi:hypothetical protein
MKSRQSAPETSRAGRDALLATLKIRFDSHPNRHLGIGWGRVIARLDERPQKWLALAEMENTGGEPDVTGLDPESGGIIFTDCSPETPKGRVSLCYDREALESRKEHRPESSAVERAAAMGVELLTEAQYHALQELGEFDGKTSSWVETPADLRRQGGALFGDRRYGRVFIYHNGAQSYFAARGFRARLVV